MTGEREEPALVRLTGELDIVRRADVHAAFQAVRNNPRVIIDITGVQYLDSTTIDELFGATERARQLGGRLVVVARNQRMVRLLSIAGLTSQLRIADTIVMAQSIVREPPGPP